MYSLDLFSKVTMEITSFPCGAKKFNSASVCSFDPVRLPYHFRGLDSIII